MIKAHEIVEIVKECWGDVDIESYQYGHTTNHKAKKGDVLASWSTFNINDNLTNWMSIYVGREDLGARSADDIRSNLLQAIGAKPTPTPSPYQCKGCDNSTYHWNIGGYCSDCYNEIMGQRDID